MSEQFDNYVKYNSSSYKIYMRDLPAQVEKPFYRGDEISLSIQCVNSDSEETPFNLKEADVRCWFSPSAEGSDNPLDIYKAKPENIVIGQSDDAVAFDQQQGNPAGTTFDEVHLVDPDYQILASYGGEVIFWDIQLVMGGSIITPISVTSFITPDQTRYPDQGSVQQTNDALSIVQQAQAIKDEIDDMIADIPGQNIEALANVTITNPSTGQALTYDGDKWVNEAVAGGGQLTEEQVQAFVGAMLTGDTQTLISVTYNNADGTVDFVVDSDLSNYDNANSGFITGYSVTQTDVTQHQAALEITESQIADLSHFSGAYDDLSGKPDLGGVSVIVDNIAALKDVSASLGQQVYARNHTVKGDGGGGVFRLVSVEDYFDYKTSSSSATISDGDEGKIIGTNIHYKNYYLDDIVRFDGGVRLKMNQTRAYNDGIGGTLFGDAISSGTLGDGYGYMEPVIEGIKVIPSQSSGVDSKYYWLRVESIGTKNAKLEWLGYKKSKSTLVFDGGSCHTMFNELARRGYNILLDAGNYYYSDNLIIPVSIAVVGSGYLSNGIFGNQNYETDLKNSALTQLYTDKNIDGIIQRASFINLSNFHFNLTGITAENNGVGFHNKCAIKQDLAYRIFKNRYDRISMEGNLDAVETPGYGSNFCYITTENVTGQYVYYGGRFTKCAIGHGNYGLRLDVLSAYTVTGSIDTDMYMVRMKQPYYLEDGHGFLDGDYLQDGEVLPFEEKDLPLIYARGSYTIRVPQGDNAFGFDDATTEAGSSYTYPRQHLYTNLYDLSPDCVIEWEASYFASNVKSGRIVGSRGIENYYDYSYGKGVVGQKFGRFDYDVIDGRFQNLLRDADVHHTVRTGLLDGSSVDFENDLDEQIGTAPDSSNMSTSYYSHIDELFRLNQSDIFGGIIVTASNIATDFVEVVIEETGGINLSKIFLRPDANLRQVQAIWYLDAVNGTEISSKIFDVEGNDSICKFTIDTTGHNVYKLIFRFIGPKDKFSLNDIIGVTRREYGIHPLGFTKTGESPLMQSADGTWWELDPPTNSGGTATWTEV